MKQVEIETGKKWAASPTPSPPPLPRFCVESESSVTKREIAKFWRQKRLNEEEHFFAAIKAAARVRARNFTEEEYKRFEESLEDDQISITTQNQHSHGIKDWWTKSKYAYLNQPADEDDVPKRHEYYGTYVPNCFSYKPTTNHLYPTSVF